MSLLERLDDSTFERVLVVVAHPDDAVFFDRYHLWTTHFKFEVFTTKCFNKNRKVKLTTTRHHKANSLFGNPK